MRANRSSCASLQMRMLLTSMWIERAMRLPPASFIPRQFLNEREIRS